jgi:uncharacterized protein with FMN-binding domain
MEDRWPAPTSDSSNVVDPLMQERLARLANRRAAVAPSARTNGPAVKNQNAKQSAGSTGKAKRRHAAKKSRVAALAMSISTTVGLSAYFYQLNAAATASAASAAGATANVVTPGVVAVGAATSGASSSAVSAANAVVVAATPSGLKDGTYAGQNSNNRWGTVQVQITVSGGAITDVTALRVPGGNGQSQQINDYAAPILRSEALQAQSSKIDTVSGATYTSNSYMKSLQSAIDVARSATAG